MAATDAMVYIVDDDASVREALAWLLRSRRLLSEAFDSAEAFEQALGDTVPTTPACILLDVRMPGASGLALFDRLLGRGYLSFDLRDPSKLVLRLPGGATNNRAITGE